MNAARLQWRPLAAGELDHERLWLAVGAASCATVAFAIRSGVRTPPCLFHLATGYPCPGCGSTRAIMQLAQGHPGAAFVFNPLTTMAVVAFAAYCVYAVLVQVLRWPRLRVERVSRLCAWVLRIAFITAIAANWWWVLAHGM